MKALRNVFLLSPVMLFAQFAYSAHRVLYQQVPQRAAVEEANNNNDISSIMQPIVEPLDDALQKATLRNSPLGIETTVKIWGTKSERSRSENRRKLSLAAMNACLFYGPYGSGKLMTIKAIAQECELPLFMYEAFLMPRSDRIQLLHQIFEKTAALKAPCLLSIRHLEAFMNDNGASTPEMIYLLCLLDAYKKFPILFIGTVQDKECFSEGLVSAFHHNVSVFHQLNTNQRKELISFNMRKFYSGSNNENLAQELAEKTDGYAYHSLEGLVQHAKMNLSVRTNFNSIHIQRQDFLDVLDRCKWLDKKKKSFWKTFLVKAKEWAIPAVIVCAVACGLFFGHKYLKRKPLLRKI